MKRTCYADEVTHRNCKYREPIVRCRDCKYVSRDDPKYPYCYRLAEYHESAVEPDGFCAWGEKVSE